MYRIGCPKNENEKFKQKKKKRNYYRGIRGIW